MQTKFLLVVLDELALLSQVDIGCFQEIQENLLQEKNYIVGAAREDPVFMPDVSATLGEQLESNDADKLYHDTRFLLECYDLAKSINDNSHSEVDHASNL